MDKRLKQLYSYAYAVFCMCCMECYCFGLIPILFLEITSVGMESFSGKQVVLHLSEKIIKYYGEWLHGFLMSSW
jgi:hypothetical protein